jgi:hypothetical protein
MRNYKKEHIKGKIVYNLNIINHQQMHFRIIKKFNIFLGKLLHVSAPRCYPHRAISSWIKLHTQLWHKNVTSKSELRLIKLIKTAG